MSLPLFWGAMWALLLLVVSLALPRLIPKEIKRGNACLLLIFATALSARLVPNFVLPMGAGYDIESYKFVGRSLINGDDVYTNSSIDDRHPYLPLQMYWIAFAYKVSDVLAIPFVKVVRLAPIGADVLIALLLFSSLRRLGPLRSALFGGLIYSLNPIPVYISAYHGQFDAIPALCILLALLWLQKSSLAAGAWLGIGILDKSWPILALPSLLSSTKGWVSRVLLIGMAAVIPFTGIGVYALVFHTNPVGVLKQALGYNWGVGVWGYTYFFRILAIVYPAASALFNGLVLYGRFLTLLTLGIIWLMKARKQAPHSGFLTILVGFFAVTHAFSIQYLVWLVPFAILDEDYRWLTAFTIGAFVYMFLVYNTLILEMHITALLPLPQADWFLIMPSGLPAWVVTVGWLVKRFTVMSPALEVAHNITGEYPANIGSE